jgi:hypothetical protein
MAVEASARPPAITGAPTLKWTTLSLLLLLRYVATALVVDVSLRAVLGDPDPDGRSRAFLPRHRPRQRRVAADRQGSQFQPANSIWVINAYQLAVMISLLPLASFGEMACGS